MNTLTQEDLANSGTPAHMFQAGQGVRGSNGPRTVPTDKSLYDPYSVAMAKANAIKDGTTDALNAAAAAGATTGVPNGVMTHSPDGNTNFDDGGSSRSDWATNGWPWGDMTEQFPVTAFGISGFGGLGNALGTITDDAVAFAQKPVFGFPLWAVAAAGGVGLVAFGVIKNPLKKGRKK